MRHQQHDTSARFQRPCSRVQRVRQRVDVLKAEQEHGGIIAGFLNLVGLCQLAGVGLYEMAVHPVMLLRKVQQARADIDTGVFCANLCDIRRQHTLSRADVKHALIFFKFEQFHRRRDCELLMMLAAILAYPAVIPACDGIPAGARSTFGRCVCRIIFLVTAAAWAAFLTTAASGCRTACAGT